MKHHLSSYCVDVADFTDEVVHNVRLLLDGIYPNMFDYNNTVLLPTILFWIVVGLAELNGPQARFYLAMGGKRNEEIAYQKLKVKARKFPFMKDALKVIYSRLSKYISSSTWVNFC